MATFRVPQNNQHLTTTSQPPSLTNSPQPVHSTLAPHDGTSVTQPPGGYDSRRNSASEQQILQQQQQQPGLPLATAPIAAAPAGTTTIIQKPALVPLATTAGGKTVVRRRATFVHEAGWSRGRKICCCICLFFTLCLIAAAVLIVYLVRTPSVEYKSAQVICANNDYIKCAQSTVQIKVFLEVTNPNIIGATVNADLGLFKTDRTFLGPGTVSDTYVGSRTTTQLEALFTITSDRAYDILVALYLPPTHDVQVIVDGTVYVHVGLLRPSIAFTQDVTIPKQSLGDTLGGLAGTTNPAGIAAALAGAAGSTSIAGVNAGDVAGVLGQILKESSTAAAAFLSSSSTGAAAAPSRGLSLRLQPVLPTFNDEIDPAKFRSALVQVGAPNSLARKGFMIHQQHSPIAQVKRSVDEGQ